MFSPALTAAPTVGTVAYATLVLSVPVMAIFKKPETGLVALGKIAVLAVASVAYNALAGMASPLYICAGAFALGFMGWRFTNECKCNFIPAALIDGTVLAVIMTTPATNIMFNGLGMLGARAVSQIAGFMGKV